VEGFADGDEVSGVEGEGGVGASMSPLFLIACGFALVGSIVFYWVRARVSNAGLKLRPWYYGADVLYITRIYLANYEGERWSLFPLLAFWALAVVAIVVGLYSALVQP
jgi:hypothetical protein